MRNELKTVLMIFAFLMWIGKADAAVLSSQFIIDQIKKDIEKQLKTSIKGQTKIEINGIPYKEIEVPEGNLQINTSWNSKNFSPVTVVKVDISINGEKIRSFGTPVRLYVSDLVWVAKDVISRGSSFTASNLSLEKKDLGLLTEYAARQDFPLYNCLSKKSYRPGDIVDTRYVEKTPVVMKNTPVSVIFKSDEITITLAAQSLEDGKIGDYIKVRSKKYKKDYVGKVIGSNTVLVNI